MDIVKLENIPRRVTKVTRSFELMLLGLVKGTEKAEHGEDFGQP